MAKQIAKKKVAPGDCISLNRRKIWRLLGLSPNTDENTEKLTDFYQNCNKAPNRLKICPFSLILAHPRLSSLILAYPRFSSLFLAYPRLSSLILAYLPRLSSLILAYPRLSSLILACPRSSLVVLALFQPKTHDWIIFLDKLLTFIGKSSFLALARGFGEVIEKKFPPFSVCWRSDLDFAQLHLF